jgi:hypothetical protein
VTDTATAPTLEDANAALRTAVEDRLAGRSPMAASLEGCKPAMEAATQVLSDAAELGMAAGCCDVTKPRSSRTSVEVSDYATRADAVSGFNRVVEEARPARLARTARTGVTQKFGTGAVRSDSFEEFRYDLVSPIGLREVARACAEGAEKYGDWNWENGMPVHDLLNHAIAHIYAFLGGDRSEPHLGHAAWNLLSAIHSHELWPHLNDGHLRDAGCKMPTGGRNAAT